MIAIVMVVVELLLSRVNQPLTSHDREPDARDSEAAGLGGRERGA